MRKGNLCVRGVSWEGFGGPGPGVTKGAPKKKKKEGKERNEKEGKKGKRKEVGPKEFALCYISSLREEDSEER